MTSAARPDRRQQRWDEHNVERRRTILDAAVALIESAPDGAALNMQQVADRAGLVRTVMYRHFNSRDELNRAVQAHIVAMLREQVMPHVNLDGSVDSLIRDAVGNTVRWAAAHPKLYVAAERDSGDGTPGELEGFIEDVAERIFSILEFGAEMLGMELSEADLGGLSAVTYGLIGQVRGTLDHWIRRPDRVPAPEALVALLSRSISNQFASQAADLGIQLDRTRPLRQLFAETQSRRA